MRGADRRRLRWNDLEYGSALDRGRFIGHRPETIFADCRPAQLLPAALNRPVRTSAIESPVDFAIAVTAILGRALRKLPPWRVVVLAAVAGGVPTK